MKPPSEVLVPISAHPIAMAQARAMARVARLTAAAASGEGDHLGEQLAYLVTAGLAIELYLKTLMISARGGRVRRGHDLAFLYSQYPAFLKKFLERKYSALQPTGGWPIKEMALMSSGSRPEPPRPSPTPQYGTFELAIQTTNDAFVRARYFFEGVNDSDWSIFEYAPGPLNAVMAALDAAYEHHSSGGFARDSSTSSAPDAL